MHKKHLTFEPWSAWKVPKACIQKLVKKLSEYQDNIWTIFKKAIATNEMLSSASLTLHIKDRIAYLKALVLGFIAENTLPFTKAPQLIKFTKPLIDNKTVLTELPMNQRTASNKMKFGLAKILDEEVYEIIKDAFFPLNIDEATNHASHMEILIFLVSYF